MFGGYVVAGCAVFCDFCFVFLSPDRVWSFISSILSLCLLLLAVDM